MSSTKYQKVIFLLLAILAVFILADCRKPAGLPVLAKSDVIVAFGDSITFGTGAKTQESYPAVLEQMIGRKVVNAGVPGEVTAEGLARLPQILDQERPALLILCHGGNDHLRRLGREQAAGNIREMIRQARQKNVAVVLIAVPAPGLSVSPEPLYRDIAKEFKIPLEEKTLSDILADHSLKSDLIHPNAAGYRRLAEAVATLLKKSGAID
ncbi:MAG: arylesterase [Deltaproteobacteria bacterium HGW-Deltaproteobacteria-13]|jgi:lysophospholipase L1-like esterase|nr:MAG: arylesterase [Deltaproteobacteria bacterium HGW-Deltaproteobacteria-13]